MSHTDVFRRLLDREVQSMMANSQLADYYCFLGLQGFKRMHERLYKCASDGYRKLSRYYVNEFYTLPEEGQTKSVSVIPSAWHSMKRTGIRWDAKKKAVRECIELWSQWEADTHALMCDAAKSLRDEGHVAAALKVEKMLCMQDKETMRAYSLRCKLESTDYDMEHVMEIDHRLHCKWKEGKAHGLSGR